MRRTGLGLALLAASAGCNQLFGIKSTDRAPDAPPLMYAGKMQWASAGAVDGHTDVFPIGNEAVDADPPHIQVGPMPGMGDLAEAPYDVATGEFKFGFMLAGQQWRLVYTLPGDSVTHELQWNVKMPDLVVPRFTRKDLMPAPSGSGYDVQPTPLPGFALPMVATSGAYTWSFAAATDYTSSELMYPFPERAVPIEGPLAAPDASDWILTTDWSPLDSNNQRMQVVSWGIATNAPLTTGLTPITPAWQTGPLVTIKPLPNLQSAQDRIRTALGALALDGGGSPLPFSQHLTYGLSPNTAIYGFAPGAPDCGMPKQGIDADLSGVDCLGEPALIPLLEDKILDPTPKVPKLDTSMIPNRPVMYARVTQARTEHGVVLTSGIQSLVLAPATPVDMETIDVLSTTVASAVLVDRIKLDDVVLSGATGDADAGPATTSPRTLTFNPRLGQDSTIGRADDFVVTLYEIQHPGMTNARLHTVRVYHLTDYAAGVMIDGSLLTPGTYVFAITARIGLQNAASGDFQTVTYPLGESTAFSRSFVVD